MEKEDNILRIKKNADQGNHFHYNRDERLSMINAPKLNVKSKGLLRGNRSLLILLLDVLLICIIVVAINLVDFGSSEKKQVSGYSFLLRGFPYKDVVLVTLAVKKVSENTDLIEDLVSVKFFLEEEDSVTYNSVSIPQNLEEEVMIRDSLMVTGERKNLKAEISAGEKTFILTRKLEWD